MFPFDSPENIRKPVNVALERNTSQNVFNYSIDELTEAECLLETSNDTEINWEPNTCEIIEALEEKEKTESEEERKTLPMII